MITNGTSRYPALATSAGSVLQQSLDVLKQLHYDWPMSKHWENALSTMTSSLSAMGSSPRHAFAQWQNGTTVHVSLGCFICSLESNSILG